MSSMWKSVSQMASTSASSDDSDSISRQEQERQSVSSRASPSNNSRSSNSSGAMADIEEGEPPTRPNGNYRNQHNRGAGGERKGRTLQRARPVESSDSESDADDAAKRAESWLLPKGAAPSWRQGESQMQSRTGPPRRTASSASAACRSA